MGWPAKGTSAREVKISMVREGEVVPSAGRCRKTISERLNSADMCSFWACVRGVPEGTWITARGLPAYRVEVKTSRVV